MHETLSQLPPPPFFLVEEVIKNGGHSCMMFFPCASGSGTPLMTVISGRKGKEGAKCIFSFFCNRRGGCLFLEVTDVGYM